MKYIEYLVGFNTRVLSLDSLVHDTVISSSDLIHAMHEQYPNMDLNDDNVYSQGFDGTEQECREMALACMEKGAERSKKHNRIVKLYNHSGEESATPFIGAGNGLEITVWYVDISIVDEDPDKPFPRVRIAEKTSDVLI